MKKIIGLKVAYVLFLHVFSLMLVVLFFLNKEKLITLQNLNDDCNKKNISCNSNLKMIPSYIHQKDLNELPEMLKIYKAYDSNGLIKLRRIGPDFDGGYIIAEKAAKLSDALLGYGVFNDIRFEESFLDIYKILISN